MFDIMVNIVVFLAAFSATMLIAHKNKWGFACFVIVEVCYTYLGLKTGQYGIVAIAIMYFCVNLYGLYKWSSDDKLAAKGSERDS